MGGGPLAGSAAPIAALVAIIRRRAERACTRSNAEGRSASGGWLWGGYFVSRCKGPRGPAENSRTSAIAGPSRLPSDRPLEGRGRASPALGRRATELSTLMD